MSGHGVMTSYVTSCSVEIGRFWDLLQLSEFPCSLAFVSSLHAGYLVLIYMKEPNMVALWSRSRMIENVFAAHFSHYNSNVLAILSLRIIV